MIAAIVPAAGRSARMGRPKLLLELHGETVIARVVKALRAGGAARVVVVGPAADAPEEPEIAAEAVRAGAEVIVPSTRPGAMRESVELALASLSHGETIERVLLAPGDTPGINDELVAGLLDRAARSPESIIIPSFEGRRGHPVVLPWSIATLIPTLPAGEGVNALAKRYPDRVVELAVPKLHLIADLDTPDDWLLWNSGQAADIRSPEVSGSRADAGSSVRAESLVVEVRLFALARERAGRSVVDLELPPSAKVAGLRDALRQRFPAIAPLMSNALIAVNEDYAGDDTPILPGSRIAVIPPVSGGAEGSFPR
jgi:molybdenum cofactor cytidylyltransferase